MEGGKDFELHLRLERQRNRHIRLTRSALCLLLAAVACWLLGLGWAWQLSASLLLGVVGLVWPVEGSAAWALQQISDQAGLAYETALALETGQRDDFGLRAQVRSRARSATAGFERPRFTEWWIAALILAGAVLLLPVLRLNAPWSGSMPPDPASPSAPLAADASDDEESQPEPEPEPELPPEPDELVVAEAPLVAEPTDSTGTEAEGAGTAPESEGDVLDRFLDNLRSRPPEEQPQVSELGTPAPAPVQDPPRADDTEAERTSPGENPGPSASPERGEGDETGAGTGEGEGDGDQEQAQGDGGPQEETTAEGAPEGGQEQVGADMGTDAPADEAGGGLDAGMGDGGGAGTEVALEPPERPGPAAGEEEFLEGILSGSEVNFGGDVRLPGFADVELPPESSPTSLGQAVERSLTEGTVPLEYQEVIRSYFR